MKCNICTRLILVVGLVFLVSNCGSSAHEIVQSPDGKLQLSFILDDGRPQYRLVYQDQEIVSPSELGFDLKDNSNLTGDLQLEGVLESSFDESWATVWGTVDSIRNHYNQLTVILRQRTAPERPIHIIFRASNDGIAFRYHLPAISNADSVLITSERTRFNLNGDHQAWWIPADYDSYEQVYQSTPLSGIDTVHTPLTMQTEDGICISIHEANLTDYPAMTIRRAQNEKTSLACDLVPWPDGIKARLMLPHDTPWRTLQIADNPGKLIESNLILNLNEPCKIEDTSWIKPMKYVGIWWGMHLKKNTWTAGPEHGATTLNARRYIDFAGRNNIGGVLMEGWNVGWETWGTTNLPDFTQPYPDLDLAWVTDYARKKGVQIIGHHETMANVAHYEKELEAALKYYDSLGIKAIKTGYVGRIIPEGQHHHGQWMVNHYRKVVKTAARYKTVLVVHEPIKDTGISRTWPNMMSREGGRGMEYNAWSPGNPPEHTTILPFTRLLAGPMDYTPGIFNILFEEGNEHRVYTTLAKQLALYVVIYSPVQMAADLIENYEGQPAFQFIRDVPVNWHETQVLDAAISDFVSIARRNNKDWYVGSITDEQARLLQMPMSFLDEGQMYKAVIYGDSEHTDWNDRPAEIEILSFRLTASDTLAVPLSPSGGQAVRIHPVTPGEASQLKPVSEYNRAAGAKMQRFRKVRIFEK